MPRFLIFCFTGLLLSACISDESADPPIHTALTATSSSSTPAQGTADQDSRARHSKTLELGEGVGARAAFEFEAPVPVEHAFNVSVNMPTGTEIHVQFLTANGMTLEIFESDGTETTCVDEGARTNCLLHFPALEAPTPGTWTAVVEKISTPRAELMIEIEWIPVGQGHSPKLWAHTRSTVIPKQSDRESAGPYAIAIVFREEGKFVPAVS